MYEFSLPDFDNLSIIEYSFSEFQQGIVDNVLSKINQLISNMMCNDEIRSVTLYAIKYFVNLFTRGGDNVIAIYCRENGYIFYKITENTNTLIEVLCNYICINISQYGVFIKYWEPLNSSLVLFSGDENDIILYMRYDEDDVNAQLNDIVDRAFESNREEVIERTFGYTHDHEITIDGNVDRNEDNSECHLCYEKAAYQCFKCNYPICGKCMETLKTSTGKCPCCQIYPLLLRKIIEKDY
jgi:hypothetical protein